MTVIPPGSIIGIIGGGQLGRMIALAAANLGYRSHIFTPEKEGPAEQVAYRVTIAPYRDKKALIDFANNVDVVTFEFENIPVETLHMLEAEVSVCPGAGVLHISQNRIREKDFIASLDIPVAAYKAIHSAQDLQSAAICLGMPAILKTAEMGYDGKGQFVIREDTDLSLLWDDAAMKTGVLEAFVDFKAEASIVIARDKYGQIKAYPLVENIHRDGILHKTIAPAILDREIADKAHDYTIRIAKALDLVGIMAIEFFITSDGVLVNEIAPRPHNSGHWTMDGCVTSQFEQCVRAICGLPLGSVDIIMPCVMENLIGSDMDAWQQILADPAAKLHLYGKHTTRPSRKMGHVTRLCLDRL